jgi:predicted permease
VTHLLRDLRYAARALLRAPLFTLGIVLTLALGIGVNAAIFGVVDTLFLKPPAGVEDPGKVVRIYVRRTDPFFGTGVGGIGLYPAFAALRDARAFDQVAAVHVRDLSMGRGAEAQPVKVAAVSAAYFPLLGVAPGQGRFFGPADDRPGAERTAVVTEAFARSHVAGAQSAIGRSLRLGGHVYTVIGVAPRGFAGIDIEPVRLFLPIEAAADEFTDPKALTSWHYWWMDMIARVPADRASEYLAARATAVYRRGISEGRQPDSTSLVVLGPVQQARGPVATKEAKVSAWVGVVAAVVLLIACANVANLLLARGVARRRELAVRAGLGAGRGGLMRMMLAESLVLAAAGGGAALVLAAWTGAAARAYLIPNLPTDAPVIDPRVLLFTGLAVLLTAVLTGLVPAIQFSRTDLTESLKSGGHGATARGGRTRAALLVAQIALTLVLLVGAGLFVRSLRNVQHIDLGFDPERVLEARVNMDDAGFDGPAANAEYLRLMDRIARLPGVAQAAATMAPFGWGFAVTVRAQGVDSIPRLAGGGPYVNVVTPGYFAALGTRLVEGRRFGDGDGPGGPRVAVVNETMARRLWPREPALGKCLYIGSDTTRTCTAVVGVVANAKRGQVTESESMLYYLPYAQGTGVWPGGAEIGGLVVRSRGPADDVAGAVRREMQAGGNLPYARVQSLADRIAPQFRSWRLGAAAFTAFGALALVIAAMGIFAVISYSVSRRTQEIGVRMALGAEAAQVVRMVLGQGLRVAALGALLGAAGAWALGRGIRSLLYEVQPADPVVFGAVTLVIVAAAALAAWLPARRAAKVEPMTALRYE